VDATVAILVVGEFLDDFDEDIAQAVAVLVVLLVLTTALQPILRRLERPARTAARAVPSRLATEALEAADRIEALNADPGNRSAEIRRECERLRELARTYEA
jgi:flagellar biosynthesis/type III secretory pathway M-ring protein FliF/YscJ